MAVSTLFEVWWPGCLIYQSVTSQASAALTLCQVLANHPMILLHHSILVFPRLMQSKTFILASPPIPQ